MQNLIKETQTCVSESTLANKAQGDSNSSVHHFLTCLHDVFAHATGGRHGAVQNGNVQAPEGTDGLAQKVFAVTE